MHITMHDPCPSLQLKCVFYGHHNLDRYRVHNNNILCTLATIHYATTHHNKTFKGL